MRVQTARCVVCFVERGSAQPKGRRPRCVVLGSGELIRQLGTHATNWSGETLRVLPSMGARSTCSLEGRGGGGKWQIAKKGTESQIEYATVLRGHSLEIEWCETDVQRIPSVFKHHPESSVL